MTATMGAMATLPTMGASPARAERTVAVAAGAGLSLSRLAGRGDLEEGYTLGPALLLDVGYRLHPRLALGLHTGFSSGSSTEYIADAAEDSFTYTTIELGLSAQLAITSRLWTAASLGSCWLTRYGNEYERDPDDHHLSYGLTLGGDLLVRPDGHRLGAYARVMQTATYDSYEGLRGFAFGVAYRYW